MPQPRPEAVAAATWWAEQLAQPTAHRTGAGPESQGFVQAVSDLVGHEFTHEQIEAFRIALAEEIERHVAGDGWRPDEPNFGSYMRSIMVDYGPDPVLADAAERAGFKLRTLDLPMKTVMWVNPGKVSVAAGHGTEPVVIWKA